ncbi:MAG: hypothetical protein L0H78_24660, partial [Humibacillus sp.]|nr:hypothetical protein [Humibacillus sp.]
MNPLGAVLACGGRGLRADLLRARRFARRRLQRHQLSAWHRWRHRALLLLVVLAGLIIFGNAAAYAADGTAAWLGLTTAKDSHGFTAANYGLSLESGGLTDIADAVGSVVVTLGWMFYRFLIVGVCWWLDFTLQFQVLDMLAGPANALSNAVRGTIGQIGVVPLFLALGAVFTGVWLFFGKAGAVLSETAVAILLATFLSGAFASPVTLLTGPHGAITGARDFGLAMSLSVMDGNKMGPAAPATSSPTPDQIEARTTGKVIEIFIRKPAQLVNYGRVFDGGKASADCIKAYDQTIREGTTDDARVQVGKACGQDALDVADNPFGSILSIGLVFIAGIFFGLFAFTLALVVAVFTALALFEAAKFFFECLKGLLPGVGRSGIFTSLCTGLLALAGVAVSLMSIGVVFLVLDNVFASSVDPAAVFLAIDLIVLLAIAAIIMLVLKAKQHARRLGDKAAAAIAPKARSLSPGKGMLATAGGAVSSTIAPVMSLRRQGQMRDALKQPHNTLGAASTGTGRGGASTDSGPQHFSRTRKVAKVTGKVATMTLASTVGAPVYGPRAAKAAKDVMTNRSNAMRAKLAASRAKATSFAGEYAGNVKTGARFASKVTGAAHLGAGAAYLSAGAVNAAAPHLAAGALALRMRGTPSIGGSHGAKTDRAPAATQTVPPRPSEQATNPAHARPPAGYWDDWERIHVVPLDQLCLDR